VADAQELPTEFLTKNVFVAGRSPDVTYNPRNDWQLEAEVNSYLWQGPGKALSISGPTKSGKTVLVERLLPEHEAIWMQGSDLASVEDFWDAIIDWLGLYDLVEVTRQRGTQQGTKVGGSIGIPKIASIGADKTDGIREDRGRRLSRQQAVTAVARAGLKDLPVPVVVDDFHYVEEAAKQPIARAIKTLIPTTSVVLIAVPHEAFDAIRRETDMGGRIAQLAIEPWSTDELMYISEHGFEALGVTDGQAVGTTLAESSYGAPFLMQELCFEYTLSLGVQRTADPPVRAEAPPNWDAFFRRIANRNPSMIFGHLLNGPKTRGQHRIDRVFKDGRKTDIYGALLYAIAMTGPKAAVSYQELSATINEYLEDQISSQQITSSLNHMSDIAKHHRGSGDQAVAYKDDSLYILDPFLLFFLRHGDWDVMK